MAIKRGSKVDPSFSSASMSDIVFLLLVFLLISTTLINPNALNLDLPKSSNIVKEKPYTTVSITADMRYYIETEPVAFSELESRLQDILAGIERPVVSIHADQTVDWGEIVNVVNIARRNKYQFIFATTPE